MIEMMKRIWEFGVEHYYRDPVGFALTYWLLNWFATVMCFISLLACTLRYWAPQVEKALDRLGLWWRGEPGA